MSKGSLTLTTLVVQNLMLFPGYSPVTGCCMTSTALAVIGSHCIKTMQCMWK
jgi:hypothetical protein